MEGYCVKCRRKQGMKNTQKSIVNGRDILKGVCSKCGTKMSKFI